MTSGHVDFEWVGTEQRVLMITLNRPERANAYTAAMLTDLGTLLELARARASVRAVVVTGAGTTFCSGADLTAVDARTETEALSLKSRDIFDAWAEAPWPTLAAINGPAVGGGFELALACDVRICSPGAFFRLPEVELGLLPGAGGVRRLVAELGGSRAKELILFGKALGAAEACRWGLVCEVSDQPRTLALQLAESVAARDALCLAAGKLLVMDQLETARGRGGEIMVQALLYAHRRRSRTT